MNEITHKKKSELNEKTEKKIKVDANTAVINEVNHSLAEIMQYFCIGENVLKVLNPDTEYFVNIPNYIRKGLSTGEYFFNEKKASGELLASIMEIKDGKRSFVSNLTLVEGKKINETFLKNISDGMFNLAIQQHYQRISDQLTEILQIVRNIEKGQKHDRFGMIIGAQKQLSNAAKDINDVDMQKNNISNALQSLYNATGMIEQELESRVKAFKAIPRNKALIYTRMVFSYNYKGRKDDEYNTIKEYIDFYIMAYELIAYAHFLEGRLDKLSDEFRDASGFLSRLDLVNLKTIEYFYTQPEYDFSKEWFNRPNGYVNEREIELVNLYQKEFDTVELKIQGKDLIRLLENDKNRL